MSKNKYKYMVQDDTNNRPLTEKEKQHIKEIESQPGYSERMKAAEKEAKELFNLE